MRKRLAALSAVIVVLVIIALIAVGLNVNNSKGQTTAQSAALGAEAPNADFILLNGNTASVSQYRGRTVLLWFVSTWCSTCAQGNEALDSNMGFFERNNVTIVEVETYKNLGYPGPTISDFISEYAPHAYANGTITIGVTSYNMMQVYDGRGYPDIYYLIAKNGTIVDISGSPGATMGSLKNAINAL